MDQSEKNEAEARFLLGKKRKLFSWQEQAREGTKLGPTDRLKAAFHLTRAWKQANKAGLRKEDFQIQVFDALKREHRGRNEFRLQNWVLKRGEDPFTQDLSGRYREKHTPQRALEPYLVGIEVAAKHCGEDPQKWQIELLRSLSLWDSTKVGDVMEVEELDDRPMETLSVLLNALCKNLAQSTRLGDTLDAIRAMNCHWDWYREMLIPKNEIFSDDLRSPLSEEEAVAIYFEEAPPYPSIPLLLVPYATVSTRFRLAPDKILRPEDATRISEGHYLQPGFPGNGNDAVGYHYNVPEDAPGKIEADGQLIWYRELRLAIVPDGHGSFVAALESRPHAKVEFDEGFPFAGRQQVKGGYDPLLERAHFYARNEEGEHVWPHILDAQGKSWRITVMGDVESTVTARNETWWCFDADPIEAPGDIWSDPWDLTWTPVNSDYLSYWQQSSWELGGELAKCLWDQDELNVAEDRWMRGLPPFEFLCFREPGFAQSIECCLHNGLILEALMAEINRLKDQAACLQHDWISQRDHYANALLRRWGEQLATEQGGV